MWLWRGLEGIASVHKCAPFCCRPLMLRLLGLLNMPGRLQRLLLSTRLNMLRWRFRKRSILPIQFIHRRRHGSKYTGFACHRCRRRILRMTRFAWRRSRTLKVRITLKRSVRWYLTSGREVGRYVLIQERRGGKRTRMAWVEHLRLICSWIVTVERGSSTVDTKGIEVFHR